MHRPSWPSCLIALLLWHSPGAWGVPAPSPAAEDPARRECGRLNDAGSYAEALPHCRQAADALRDHAGTAGGDDGGALGRALTSLGLALEMTGDRSAAEASYREALARHRAGGQPELEALVLSNLAALAIGGGDYGAALARLGEEEAVTNRALAAGNRTWAPAELEYVRLNRSVALEQLGAYAEALAEIRPLSMAALEAGGERASTSESAALAVNLAVLYRNLGDPRRALELLERARAAYERLGDRSALANVHLNRALVYQLNLRAPESAAAELARALELALASGDRGEEIRTLCALGELRRSSGRLDDAQQAFERALRAAVESEATAGRWTALAGLGRVARDAGDSGAALVHLRAAIAEIEKAGEGLGDAALRSGLLADQRAVYATAVDLLAERALALTAGDEAARAALALAEQAKARELLDALAAGSAGSGRSGRSGRSGTPLGEAELGALSRQLGPALAYFFGERQLWRFELDDGRWRVARAGPPAEIAELVIRIHRALAGAEPPRASDLARLGELLLPAAIPGGEELRIVPDGSLFYLPFELLPDPERAGATLLERTAVSYLPSLAVAAHLRPATAATHWRVAALANPEFGASAPAGTSSLADLLAQRFGLPPLPGAAREARAAAARLGEPSVVDTGGAATEAKLRQRAAEGARVLHIAAHTVVDEALAGGVALFLARGSGPSPPKDDDGLVTAVELAQLPLVADLAVLSGCRTALAETALGGGDGAGGGRAMASLSGALLGAGARGVVASLWEVGDDATAALMEQFYFGLARGSRPAIALRRAKLRLAHDPRWAAAPGWAGFVLLGNPQAVAPTFGTWGWLAGALALVTSGALLLRRSRRRDRAEAVD